MKRISLKHEIYSRHCVGCSNRKAHKFTSCKFSSFTTVDFGPSLFSGLYLLPNPTTCLCQVFVCAPVLYLLSRYWMRFVLWLPSPHLDVLVSHKEGWGDRSTCLAMRAIYRRQNCKAGIHLSIQTNFNFQILQYLDLLLTRSYNQWPLLWSDSTLTKALSILTRRGRGDLDWEVAKCTKHQPSLPQPPQAPPLSQLQLSALLQLRGNQQSALWTK